MKDINGRWRPEDFRKLGLAIAVVFDPHTHTIHVFTSKQGKELAALLRRAELVVGYNIKAFDLEVLKGCRGFSSRGLHFLDMLAELKEITECEASLDEVLTVNFGSCTTSDGLELVKAWKNGDVTKVVEGCVNDVLGMARLFEHARRHGSVLISKRGANSKSITVKWR